MPLFKDAVLRACASASMRASRNGPKFLFRGAASKAVPNLQSLQSLVHEADLVAAQSSHEAIGSRPSRSPWTGSQPFGKNVMVHTYVLDMAEHGQRMWLTLFSVNVCSVLASAAVSWNTMDKTGEHAFESRATQVWLIRALQNCGVVVSLHLHIVIGRADIRKRSIMLCRIC